MYILNLTENTGLLLLGVMVSGIVEEAPLAAMLAATAATDVAWNCGDQVINLGEQVARHARGRPSWYTGSAPWQ